MRNPNRTQPTSEPEQIGASQRTGFDPEKMLDYVPRLGLPATNADWAELALYAIDQAMVDVQTHDRIQTILDEAVTTRGE